MSTCILSARYPEDPTLELVYNDMSLPSQLSPMDIENEVAVASICLTLPNENSTITDVEAVSSKLACDDDTTNVLQSSSNSDLSPSSLTCDNGSVLQSSSVQPTSDLPPSKLTYVTESTSAPLLRNFLEFPHFLDVGHTPNKLDKRGPKLTCIQVCKKTQEPCSSGCFTIPFCGRHKKTVQAKEYLQLYGTSANPMLPVEVILDTPTDTRNAGKVTAPLMSKTIAQAQIKAKQFGIKSKTFGRTPRNPPSETIVKEQPLTLTANDSARPQPLTLTPNDSARQSQLTPRPRTNPPSSTNIINSKPQSSALSPRPRVLGNKPSVTCPSPRPRVLGNKPSVTCPSVSIVERDNKILSWYMGTKDIKTIDFRYMWEGYKYLVILEHTKPHMVTTLTRDGFLNITLPKCFKFTPNRKGQMKYVRSYKHVLLDGLYERRLRWVFNTRKSEVPVRGGTSV